MSDRWERVSRVWGSRRSVIPPPEKEDFDDVSADRRQELINQERQNRHQAISSLVLLLSISITAVSVYITAQSLRISRQEFQNNQDAKYTEQYSRATDQLGSTNRQVRINGIYALNRLAEYSLRDRPIVIKALANYVRDHAPALMEPAPDVSAALVVLSDQTDRSTYPTGFTLDFTVDLRGIRIPGSKLSGKNLSDWDLTGADLHGSDLSKTKSSTTVMQKVNLRSSDLHDADLSRADLRGADLRESNLRGANLRGADLTGADVRGTKLTGIRGVSSEELRNMARAAGE